jgi:cobalt/nickel transport system permease protein
VSLAAPDGRLAGRRQNWLHRSSPRAKLLGLIGFAVVVVATPREWVPAYGVYLAVVVVLLGAARVPLPTLGKRMLIETPFLVFALLLPLIATGPRIALGPLSLSEAGLWGAWALLAKATLTLLAATAFAASTEPRRIVAALESLWLPRELTSILGFMLRYLEVIGQEAARMRVARQARGFQPRGPRDWRTLASGIGALFIRAHGRGERVHLAMLSRGYREGAR